MAIEGMKKVTLLVPSESCEDAVGALQSMGLMHFTELPEDWTSGQVLAPIERSARRSEEQLRRVEAIEALFHELDPLKKGFMASLVNVPLVVPRDEFQSSPQTLDLEALAAECQGIADEHHEAQRQYAQIEAEIAVLGFFRDIPIDAALIYSLQRVHVWIGSTNARRWEELETDTWAAEHMAFQVLSVNNRNITICAVAMEEDREEAGALLKRCELAERPLPSLDALQPGRVAALRERLDELSEQCNRHRERVRELTAAHRHQVAVAGEYWRTELARMRALRNGATSRRVSVFAGYVRSRDTARFEQDLAQRLPAASVSFADPGPDDTVPVSIRLNGALRPMKFLVKMFGLPDYYSFDPTPYLSFSFLLFFGLCYGDVAYGVMLCAVAGYLAWKARRFGGLYELTMMFFYGGVATIIFGALTGSWAGDLWKPEYLGQNNILLRLKNTFAVIDPLQKPVFMLLVSLGIGVCNQLYGIILKGYGMWRRGDRWGAVFDAGLWLLVLPGFLLVAGKLFFTMESMFMFEVGAGLFGVGALGLILTQGRAEKGFFAKAATGVVSIYGIMGTYGCVAFLGDMLSYSRLLALGLTTSIVAMTCNIMAGLVRGVPDVGIALFILVLVVGHVFNFGISMLGAFVHSARLIFLEFFSRFYEANGVPFQPLSVNTGTVLVTSSETDAA